MSDSEYSPPLCSPSGCAGCAVLRERVKELEFKLTIREDAILGKDGWRDGFERVKRERDALVMEVATKHPGESRYETALRYIRERETHHGEPGQCKANKELTNTAGSHRQEEG